MGKLLGRSKRSLYLSLHLLFLPLNCRLLCCKHISPVYSSKSSTKS
nr:MAG TPA: hypothetical protein [Caudoviricetes sp.]